MQAFRLFAVNNDILFRFGFIFYKYAFLINFFSNALLLISYRKKIFILVVRSFMPKMTLLLV